MKILAAEHSKHGSVSSEEDAVTRDFRSLRGVAILIRGIRIIELLSSVIRRWTGGRISHIFLLGRADRNKNSTLNRDAALDPERRFEHLKLTFNFRPVPWLMRTSGGVIFCSTTSGNGYIRLQWGSYDCHCFATSTAMRDRRRFESSPHGIA